MRELQSRWTTRHSGWPSFDLHEENGELVLHADVRGFDDEGVQISLDGGHLVVQSKGESERDAPACYSCLPLPFPSGTVRVVSRPGHKDLEIRIRIPILAAGEGCEQLPSSPRPRPAGLTRPPRPEPSAQLIGIS